MPPNLIQMAKISRNVKIGSYVSALLSVVVIAIAEELFHAPIDDKSRFLILLIPVAIPSWMGGTGPGVVGLMAASLVGASFLPPKYSLEISKPSDIISFILYVFVSAVVIGIIESLRRSRQALAESDLTVRKLNADLNHSLGLLEESLRRQKRFTADASHELKTPLTAIRARTGIALSAPADSEELVEHIVAMNRASEVMITVVQDLMLLAASDEGQLQIRKEPTSVQLLVEDALASVDVSKHHMIVPEEGDFEVDCDPSAITRVLVNILQNAVVHTQPGKEVSLSYRRDDMSVIFVITDTGSGIPADHVGRIFDRFHRVDSSRDRESGGSGLGLAIAQAIVDAHGGAIKLESELGQGTRVTVTLPL